MDFTYAPLAWTHVGRTCEFCQSQLRLFINHYPITNQILSSLTICQSCTRGGWFLVGYYRSHICRESSMIPTWYPGWLPALARVPVQHWSGHELWWKADSWSIGRESLSCGSPCQVSTCSLPVKKQSASAFWLKWQWYPYTYVHSFSIPTYILMQIMRGLVKKGRPALSDVSGCIFLHHIWLWVMSCTGSMDI